MWVIFCRLWNRLGTITTTATAIVTLEDFCSSSSSSSRSRSRSWRACCVRLTWTVHRHGQLLHRRRWWTISFTLLLPCSSNISSKLGFRGQVRRIVHFLMQCKSSFVIKIGALRLRFGGHILRENIVDKQFGLCRNWNYSWTRPGSNFVRERERDQPSIRLSERRRLSLQSPLFLLSGNSCLRTLNPNLPRHRHLWVGASFVS